MVPFYQDFRGRRTGGRSGGWGVGEVDLDLPLAHDDPVNHVLDNLPPVFKG
jgi:hypothetical protein